MPQGMRSDGQIDAEIAAPRTRPPKYCRPSLCGHRTPSFIEPERHRLARQCDKPLALRGAKQIQADGAGRAVFADEADRGTGCIDTYDRLAHDDGVLAKSVGSFDRDVIS